MRSIHCTCAVLAALATAVPARAQQPAPEPVPTSSFTVFIHSVPVGAEQMAVTHGADGWTIESAGRLGAPFDILARRVRVRYTTDWKPIDLDIDAAVKGQAQVLHATVSGTTATSDITINGQTRRKVDTIAPDAVMLPNPFFGPYEALAARLKDLPAGSALSAYAAPQVSFPIRVGDSETERFQTPTGIITVRHTHVTLMTPGVPLEIDIWADPDGRLLRISVPAQELEVVREDLASVSARRVTVSRPNDEQVQIPGNGFSLAATASKPFDAPKQPMRAVILVAGSGPAERDEVAYGVPIFGQLSSALADAGFFVIRYDKRGVGQSGGRLESAGLADFAEDLRAVVKYTAHRKDVDPKRIAVAGYGEGGDVALLAASKDKQIAALVLLAAPGTSGSDLVLARQQRLLDRSSMSEADKEAKIELQKKINEAAATGKGMESLPPDVRRQVDNPWFQSFLAFDPAKIIRDVRQPILIVQGQLDTEIAPSNGELLEALAGTRKNAPPTEQAKLQGINHLFTPATTGEVDEYSSLKAKEITPELATTIAGWLQKTLR